jgi:hypothetical protein
MAAKTDSEKATPQSTVSKTGQDIDALGWMILHRWRNRAGIFAP